MEQEEAASVSLRNNLSLNQDLNQYKTQCKIWQKVERELNKFLLHSKKLGQN